MQAHGRPKWRGWRPDCRCYIWKLLQNNSSVRTATATVGSFSLLMEKPLPKHNLLKWACCSCWWYAPRSLHDHVCHCPGVEGLLLICHNQPQFSVRCCFNRAVDMCRPCLRHLTQLCARCHAEASHTRLHLHLALSRWLWSACIQPSLSADKEVEALLFLKHNNFDAV